MFNKGRFLLFVLGFAAAALVLTVALLDASPTAASGVADHFAQPVGQTGQVSRGQWVVTVAGCVDCHSAYNLASDRGIPLAGGLEFNLGPALGTYYPANLTALQDWTLEDFDKAIRQGISKIYNGRTLAPVMPYEFHNGMSDDDLKAAFEYLQGLTPVENNVPEAKPGPAAAMFQPLPARSVTAPAVGATADYGQYIVENVAHCGSCHSPRNQMGLILQDKRLAGGTFNLGDENNPVFATPILGSVLTAAGYTEATFKNLLSTGTRPWGAGLPNQMPWRAYAIMSDDEMAAVWNFLQTQTLNEPWPAPAGQ